MSTEIIVSTFYQFTQIHNVKELKFEIYRFCKQHNIFGTVLLAEEGINSTLSGTAASISKLKQFLYAIDTLQDISFKDSCTAVFPFKKLKVKIKDSIIKLGHEVDISNTGEYLDHKHWDTLLSDSNSIIIDTRNDYEVEHGTFENAVNPKIDNFSDLPQWLDDHLTDEDKNKNILMFCTGGVRCEKSTAYLKDKGYQKVYHLEGGIIKYLQDTKNRQNKWQGECFVFDDRKLLNKNLEQVTN